MAFDINFYKNISEKNAINKEIINVLTLTGDLKSNTSLVDPTILIEGNLSDLVNSNYMRIQEFNRYYFINDLIMVRKNLIEVHAHCDVLMSFKNQIMENDAIIRRQEEKWNLYLDDGTFKVYQNPMVLTKKFPSGFTKQEFVLAVAGS